MVVHEINDHSTLFLFPKSRFIGKFLEDGMEKVTPGVNSVVLDCIVCCYDLSNWN